MYTHRQRFSCRSSSHPMTLFEFLSAATRTRIVSSDFRRIPLDLLAGPAILSSLICGDELLTPRFALDLFFLLLLFDRLKEKEKTERVLLDAVHQVFKQFVRFFLVFDQWIALSITA